MARYVVRIASATAADSVFVPMFGNAYLISASVVNDAVPGVDAVLSFKSGATEVASCTVVAAASIGDQTEAVPTANLKTLLSASAPLEIACDGGQTTSTGFDILVDIDEYARPVA